MSNDVIQYFLELIAIDSESRDERGMMDRLREDLEGLGARVEEDDAGKSIDGNAGNLYALIPGKVDKKPILFCAHVDTVRPGKGIKAIRENGRIRTDGSTVLGGDDKSGVAEIMQGIRQIVQSGQDHAPIEILFTVAEEVGLLGAKYFDKGKLTSAFGYAFDSHRVGELDVGAPAQNSIKIEIFGKEAHAGVEPEKGVNAIRVASEAISAMPMGRIDHETTCNIGIIGGGTATNIVPNRVLLKGESRSHNDAKLEKVSSEMRQAVENVVKRYEGSSYEWNMEQEYASFRVGNGEQPVQLAIQALKNLDIKSEIKVGGGGSDANIINAAGTQMIICGTGMNKVHTVEEDIEEAELRRGEAFVAELIRLYSQGG